MHRGWLIGVVAVFLLWGALSLKSYPPVNYNLGDELWAARASKAFLQGEVPGSVVAPRLYFALLGAFLHAGGWGVFGARAFSLLAAAGCLLLLWLLARRLTDEGTALLAVLLLASSYAFLWHSHVARHEMLTALVVLLAFHAILRGFSLGRGPWLLLGGLLAGLSVGVHPNNLQYVFGLALACLWIGGGRLLGGLWWLSGLALAFLAWLVANPALLQEHGLWGTLGRLHRLYPFPLFHEPLAGLLKRTFLGLPGEFLEYLRLFNIFFPNRLDIAAVAFPAVALLALGLLLRIRPVPLLGGFVLFTYIIGHFLAQRFGYWHMVEFYPFLALALAASLRALQRRLRRWGLLAWALAGWFILAGVGDTLLSYRDFRPYSYQKVLEAVAFPLPEGQEVMGVELYRPAFPQGQYVLPWFDMDSRRCPPVAQGLKQSGAEYVILDDLLRGLARASCGPRYERELLWFLNTRGRLLRRPQARYPNYWAPGGMIRHIYILKVLP